MASQQAQPKGGRPPHPIRQEFDALASSSTTQAMLVQQQAALLAQPQAAHPMLLAMSPLQLRVAQQQALLAQLAQQSSQHQ